MFPLVQQSESSIRIPLYCIHIYIERENFLPILITTDHWIEFHELSSRFSLVIYFIHSISSVYMSIPVSQFIPLSLLLCYSCSLCLYFCFANNITYNIFLFSTHKHQYRIFAFLFLTSSILYIHSNVTDKIDWWSVT